MFEAGLIGISNNKKGILPSLIRFFTRSKYTHCFVTLGPIFDVRSVIEASQIVQVVPFDLHYAKDTTEDYLLFKVKSEKTKEALNYIISEFSGVQYGYLEIVWFIYRWFMSLFGKDIRHEKNWFSSGVICSELVYWYIHSLGDEYQALLSAFNSETIQAQDILDILQSRTDLFESVKA